MTYQYYDRNGNEILAGMTITDDAGNDELVLVCYDEDGEEDLGIDATNWNSPSVQQGLSKPMCYPLGTIDLSDMFIKAGGGK